jgi:hypothetical protein
MKYLRDLTAGEREVLTLALTVKTEDELIAFAVAAIKQEGAAQAEAGATGLAQKEQNEGHDLTAAVWFAVGFIIREMVRPSPTVN